MSIQKTMLGALLCIAMLGTLGCSSNQTTKDIWKDTKSIWYSNVNVPASIDYDDTGSLDDYEEKLSASLMGMDAQISALEKIMSNADKPPTQEFIASLFTRFPWLSGFSGIKADGTLIGQVPGAPIKALDFYPLLEEDAKQNARALRGYVQDTAMGPEVFMATPLYDAHSFLGIVTVYFDMRALLSYSASPEELVILAPNALLWAGKYDFASTPLSGIAWDTVVLEESSGTVTSATGSFYWTVRYIGNMPLIFAVAMDEGSFGLKENLRTGPTGNGPFPEPRALKLPPEPELEPIPMAKPKPQRRVQRPAPALPASFTPPPEEPIEPVRMPSPFGNRRPATETAPETAPEAAPETASETVPEASPEQTTEQATESAPEAAPEQAPAPSSVQRPSPFGPQ